MNKIKALFLIIILLIPAVSKSQSPFGNYQMTPRTLNDRECMNIYLQMMENFVVAAEKMWQADDRYEKGGGRFDAAGDGVRWARGNSNICMLYATLLYALPDQQTFTYQRIPRSRLEDHLIHTLRYMASAYRNDRTGQSQDTLYGPGWQISLDMVGALWAGYLFEKNLDKSTAERLKDVAAQAANSLDKAIPTYENGDTGSEDCCWNGPFLLFIASRYASDSRAPHWCELALKWLYNIMSHEGDDHNTRLADGQPLNHWIVSQNAFPDLTIINHGMWSTGYQVQCFMNADAEIACRMLGCPVPEALSFRANEMWQGVGRSLFLRDGDMMLPTGQDWGYKNYEHLEYLAWMRCFMGQADAGAYESRGLQMMLRRQQAVGTGLIGVLNAGNNTVSAKRWAFAYLTHRFARYHSARSMNQACKHGLGAYDYPFTDVVIQRTPLKVVTASYHSSYQPIYIIPQSDSRLSAPPFMVTYDRYNFATTLRRSDAPEAKDGIRKVELIDKETGKQSFQITYKSTHALGATQFTRIISRDDETTLIATVFRADRDGSFTLIRPLQTQVGSIQGFPLHVQTTRGSHYLNFSALLGFVSRQDIPQGLAEGQFCAAPEQTFSVHKGDWFGFQAVAVYVSTSDALLARYAAAFSSNIAPSPSDCQAQVALQTSKGRFSYHWTWK